MEQQNRKIVVRGCRIVGPGLQATNRKSILISGGVMEDMLPDDAVPACSEIYDFPGLVITPWFCDYHLHFSAQAAGVLSGTVETLLAHGITKAYEGGDAAGSGLRIRKLLTGKFEIVSSGRALFREGGYGKYIGQAVRNAEQARSSIDALLTSGADYVKIVQSGIYAPETDGITAGGFERKELGDIIGYAKDRGLAVFCHANGAAAVREAVEEGASAIVHGLRVDDETLHEMREKSILFIPTVAAFRSLRRLAGSAGAMKNLERAVDGHLSAVSRAHAKGVTVLPGSDAGPAFIPYGTSFIHELESFMEAGIPYDDVIRSASASTLELHKPADLLVLDKFEINGMFLRGRFLR